MDTVEIFKLIGSSFGYILSLITLTGLVVGKITGRVGIFIRKQANVDKTADKITAIEEEIDKDVKDTQAFRENLKKTLGEIKNGIDRCERANVELLGAHIEEIYNRRKDDKYLTETEAQKLSHIFTIYTEYGGNSYGASLYHIMMKTDWEIK